MRIPLRILRFEAAPVQDWGFNVQRTIAHRQELDEWADIPRTAGGYVSRLGRLEGLVGLQPPRADLELRPFVVGKVGRQDASFGPLLGASGPANWAAGRTARTGDAYGTGASVGADARWHITRDLTLDGTLNPDFAQVEADQLVLNLTTVETFYPEKRPFFLEGLDIFSTPLGVLYTRRIGQVPQLPRLPEGEEPRASVAASAIPAALKVVGRLTNRSSVGLLSAVTARNTLPVGTPGGEQFRLADPTTLFNVLRLRRGFGDRGSYLGVIGSATNRFESPGLYPSGPDGAVVCPGGSSLATGARCYRDAYVAGLDGRWRSPSGDYAASAQSVLSILSHGMPTQLRDGTVLGPGNVGSGTQVVLAKEGGRHWVWQLTAAALSRKLELNDVGYLGRQNLASGTVDLAYRTKEPWGPTLETATQLELRQNRNLDGLVLRDHYQINTTVLLRNSWTLFTEIHYRASYFDDREIGDGTALQRAGLWGWEGSFRSDPRRQLAGRLFGTLQRMTNGWHADLTGSFVLRPSPRMDLELLPEIAVSSGEPRFMEEQPGGELLFGRLDAANIGATVRLTFTFTPRLTLQSYAQLFLARGRYSDLSTFSRAPGTALAIRLADLAPAGSAPAEQHDFERAALNVSLVLRWEYRLGSLLYVVYTRSQVPQIDLLAGEQPRLDLSVLPRASAADVLLVKLSYWFG